ncbi:hypothetical protein GIW81_12155 [Hyphomicrobium sp. xq]|uniref:Uncharacterized protein n=1 Tax=Hyphomicrobium album TaxID=2665159 RepID=A0A6I3KHD0_9HYPH|nr:hypothetical protein [Hyphomicrobium album]MTD95085.1 hypothetical protein [Hyphomicrobium album]
MVHITDFADKLKEIRLEWDKAESSIKIAEQINNQVVFPAVKELRYAGRRIVDALANCATAGDESAIRALLDDALFDCYRARHDAIDAAISKISTHLDAVTSKLGYSALTVGFPEFSALYDELGKAQEVVASSRGMRSDRDKLYVAIESVNMPPLVALYRKFKSSEPVMRGLAREERITKLITIGSATLIGLAALIVAIWQLSITSPAANTPSTPSKPDTSSQAK